MLRKIPGEHNIEDDYNIHKDRLQYRIMYRINTVRILNKYDKNQVFIIEKITVRL